MQDMITQLATMLAGGQGMSIPQSNVAMMPATIQRQNMAAFQPTMETANAGVPLANNQVTTVAQTAAQPAAAPAAAAASGAVNKRNNNNNRNNNRNNNGRNNNTARLSQFEKNMNKAVINGPNSYTNAQERNLGVNNDTIGYGLNPNNATSGMVKDKFTDLFAGRPPQQTWGNPNGLRTNNNGTGGPMTPQQSGMARVAATGAEGLSPVDPLDETAKLPDRLF